MGAILHINTSQIRYLMIIFNILMLQSCPLRAQYFSNPSFEGLPGISICPPDWIPFNLYSTPDTEPLACDTYPASEGNTYITLVARGVNSSHPNTYESCQTELISYLNAESCYTVTMDLASRNDLGLYKFGEGFIYYVDTVNLKIYGSNSISDRGDLLLETSDITNHEWETVSFTFKPDNEIQYIVLEVGLLGTSSGPGNVIIDNLFLEEVVMESTVIVDDTFNLSDLPLTLQASEGISYSWNPATGLSCNDCRSPQVTSAEVRTYTCIIISSLTGCPVEELFILNFLEDPIPPGEFKIPNVFTPNDDGINDNFFIQGLPTYSSLIIYDRSGKEIYKSEEYQNNWNGTDIGNNPLPSDTYWYVLIMPGLKGKQKGFVYLKRE